MNTTMAIDTGLSILPILSLLFTFIPFVFVIWFMIKLISLQKERNRLLANIADKLDKTRN
ncbi:hypothetical protein [Lysinibacillus sp. 38-6]|uniref:hypothetical protein n=1 Tax=Lysinibacillus sp. 38-6 TaxID=3385991 RepID=UPI003908B321